MAIRLFHRDHPTLRLPLISKDARFVIWPGVGAGEGNVPHIHTLSEDTIFILEGEGTIYDYTNDIALPFHAGCIVHVPVGIKHDVKADRGTNVVSVGGPSPADVPLLKAVGALPADAEPPPPAT